MFHRTVAIVSQSISSLTINKKDGVVVQAANQLSADSLHQYTNEFLCSFSDLWEFLVPLKCASKHHQQSFSGQIMYNPTLSDSAGE